MNSITLPPAILKRLEKISAASHHSTKFIINSAIREKLDYEEWALKQIDGGLSDIKAGKVLSHEDFLKRLEQSRHGRKKTA